MDPAAALSRSLSGKHLSFRSNLHGISDHFTAPAPAAAATGSVRILSHGSLSFDSDLYGDDFESDCIINEGQFGFDYAIERLEKRQMFLRSYRFSASAKAEESRVTLSRKVRAWLFRLRASLWMVIACNPPCARAGHNRFVHVHRHGNPSSSQICVESW